MKQISFLKVFVLVAVLFTAMLKVSAQIEVDQSNNVKIGNATTSDARLTIEGQYGAPGNSNLSIGNWGFSSISVGVHTDYAWIQSFASKPLIINKLGNDVLFCNQFTWGDVGIGYNVNPSCKLHVEGAIYASGTITPSDQRFKKNIEKYKTDFTKLKKFEAKQYLMDGSTKYGIEKGEKVKMSKIDRAWLERTHYGFLAQDVQKVFPELVYEDDKGYLAIDYMGFVPILFATVKEQQTKIEELEERLLKLEKQSK